jgi:lipopolysaccharide transport system ATP-binding protein
MSHPAISVENLSKAYRIGLKDVMHDTLVGALKGVMYSPLKNWRRLSRLDTFRHNGHADDIFWALKDVSFEVQEGEVLGIIGRNGAGKSTLLKILSRITEPTSGRAVIRGRVSSLLEVGTGFHPELTGRENIYMNGTILGMTKREIDRKLDAIIDFSGVEQFLDTPVKRYSSGMKVRLAFAVAAHLEPEILIIDEVLAVGDSEFQKRCLGKMHDVAASGRTVLFVSHNMTAVENLCTRAILLQKGKLSSDGDSASIVQQYLEDSCTTAACIDLRGVSDGRKGSGEARFVEVSIFDNDRALNHRIAMGESI